MRNKTLAGALAAVLAFAPTAAFADRDHGERGERRGRDMKNPFAGIPVTGTSSAGAFKGTLDIVGWQTNKDGGIDAIGILNGTLGGVPAAENMVVTWPLASGGSNGPFAANAIVSQQVVCNVLNLVLGALHLNLLGLNVDLNQVVLNITAVPGAGNLVGNLLCGIAGLLDIAAIGPILAGLLNNVTTILAGLGL
ncbi:MAG TPA: hypothetical protein VFK90_09085 [Anaeromyxobacter sp.]|nr:hypothetical protein [Anaeromyxobacter sp.]